MLNTAPTQTLPAIPAKRLPYHQQACEYLRTHMQKGPIDFATYMQEALYHPIYGYYNAPYEKIGPDGDFTTASHWSDFFGFTLANWVKRQMESTGIDTLFECGPGNGYMMAQLLKQLKHLSCMPKQILLNEVSPFHRELQKKTIAALMPEALDAIEWVSMPLENPTSAIVIANEVLDALPVHRFMYHQNQFYLCLVGIDDHQKFQWMTTELESTLPETTIQNITKCDHKDNTYISEYSHALKPYLSSLYDSFDKAMMLFIDYGYPEYEYYHAQRSRGTLKCFFQHHQHNNPLILTAIQDITAHVDFSQLASLAYELGFHINGYTTQAHFLLEHGILERNHFAKAPSFDETQIIKKLLMPQAMGERCKAMVISKDLNCINPTANHCQLHTL